MYNKKIAEIFGEIADMLDLEGENRSFEARAYRNAARTISSLQVDVSEILKKSGVEGIMELPGIGKTIAERIKEYVETGKIAKYNELKKKYPIDFAALTKIQGLGSKKVFKLYKELGIRNVDDLRKAVEAHKIRELEDFGEKSEENIAKGLEFFAMSQSRIPLGVALPEAESIIRRLLESKLVSRAVVAGSTRRMRETVGDLDILVTSNRNEEVMDFVTKLPEVENIVVKGPTKTTVGLKIGITCDVRVVSDESFGSALQYFTGSKEHGIAVRQIAIKNGYKLSEYGLFDKHNKNVVAGQGEEAIYKTLGMDYIPPEMREARGEIALALKHNLPKLVEAAEIRGDLHIHTTFSDGANTIDEMVEKAISLGMEYIGFSDHTKSEYVAHGMDGKQFAKYFAELEKAEKKYEGQIKILKSGEVDILKDGSLDLDRRTLELMDYRICAIHTQRNMPRSEMTSRIVKALESGYADILAHPSDRLINERAALNIDFDKVFEVAKENNVAMEINAQPSRLDLNDENIMKAKEYGLKFEIGTDSHHTSDMEFMRYGIGTARRGWLTKGEIINTLDYKQLLKLFEKK
ncbi:MAG: DNA polymerase/3'-5' exonuclease PolX [Candidatus Micrarchaeaceae archaeon]